MKSEKRREEIIELAKEGNPYAHSLVSSWGKEIVLLFTMMAALGFVYKM